jgi:hypothetical protein
MTQWKFPGDALTPLVDCSTLQLPAMSQRWCSGRDQDSRPTADLQPLPFIMIRSSPLAIDALRLSSILGSPFLFLLDSPGLTELSTLLKPLVHNWLQDDYLHRRSSNHNLGIVQTNTVPYREPRLSRSMLSLALIISLLTKKSLISRD